MKPEPILAYSIKRWEMRDILVFLLVIISILLAGWALQSKKTKYVIIVVEESVKDDVRYYRAKSKEKIEKFMMRKMGI